jgi:hypothetical protein
MRTTSPFVWSDTRTTGESPTAVTAESQISASLLDMELDEIFCPDASDLPPPTPEYDDALEM